MNQLAAPSAMTPAPSAPGPDARAGQAEDEGEEKPGRGHGREADDRPPGHGLGPAVADEDALVEPPEADGPRPEDEEDHRPPGQPGDVGREAHDAPGDEVEDGRR